MILTAASVIRARYVCLPHAHRDSAGIALYSRIGRGRKGIEAKCESHGLEYEGLESGKTGS